MYETEKTFKKATTGTGNNYDSRAALVEDLKDNSALITYELLLGIRVPRSDFGWSVLSASTTT